MPELQPRVMIAFPGQGGKRYEGSVRPEVALYRESVSNYYEMCRLFPSVIDSNPVFFGNSFGLYAAGEAAGVYTHEVGELLVVTRADLIRQDEEKRVAEGKSRTGMAVVLGQRIDEIRALVSRTSEKYRAILLASGLAEPADLHHTNTNGHTNHVVSGDMPFLEALVAFFGEKRAQLLPIDAMYHAESRRRVSEQYSAEIDRLGIKFEDPSGPMIASTRPRILTRGDQVKEELITQIFEPVDLLQVIEEMKKEQIGVVIDPGPGQFANQVLKRNNPGLRVVSYDTELRPGSPIDSAIVAARNFIAGLRNPLSPPGS